MTALRFGADRAEEALLPFRGMRVGLVTTPTGRTSDNRSTIDVLRGCCNLRVLFGPEHGARGDRAAGELVPRYTDKASGLPVHSLYGEKSRRLTAEMLAAFDVLVYDIQDVGSRYYTFLSTLRYLLEDCAAAQRPLVVLDRPNPLGGEAVEGNLMDPALQSFVGCYPFPNRYALTAGEYAHMINAEQRLGCALTVVPCEGWRREMLFPDWRLPWVMPSPNIPRFETALLYVGTCLFEGTNCSEGRGTADPFAIVGAPWVTDAESDTAEFNALALPGVTATPVYFVPTASKHAGALCGGVHLHVADARALRPLAVGTTLLDLLRRRHPEFSVLPPPTAGGRPFLSLLAGHRDFEGADWTPRGLQARQAPQECAFARRKAAYHLY